MKVERESYRGPAGGNLPAYRHRMAAMRRYATGCVDMTAERRLF